jgi:hypothetical protein
MFDTYSILFTYRVDELLSIFILIRSPLYFGIIVFLQATVDNMISINDNFFIKLFYGVENIISANANRLILL